MKNVALEFLKSRKGEIKTPSPECRVLLNYYKSPKVLIDKKYILFDIAQCPIYYKNKYKEFINLVEYLETINMTIKDYSLVVNFLKTCSKLEAEVFFLILTKFNKKYFTYKLFTNTNIGMCTVQKIPLGAKTLIVKLSLGSIKTLYGVCPKELEASLKKSFSNFKGTLYGYVKDTVFYLHDILSSEPTYRRILFISNLAQSKFFKVLRATFHINYEDFRDYYRNYAILIKPIHGKCRETYIKRREDSE